MVGGDYRTSIPNVKCGMYLFSEKIERGIAEGNECPKHLAPSTPAETPRSQNEVRQEKTEKDLSEAAQRSSLPGPLMAAVMASWFVLQGINSRRADSTTK
jgi:hypothetical protein